MEKEIKRLRHHVSVLSKRNHQLMKDGKSWAVSSIASDTSQGDVESVVEEERVEEDLKGKVRVTMVASAKIILGARCALSVWRT